MATRRLSAAALIGFRGRHWFFWKARRQFRARTDRSGIGRAGARWYGWKVGQSFWGLGLYWD